MHDFTGTGNEDAGPPDVISLIKGLGGCTLQFSTPAPPPPLYSAVCFKVRCAVQRDTGDGECASVDGCGQLEAYF